MDVKVHSLVRAAVLGMALCACQARIGDELGGPTNAAGSTGSPQGSGGGSRGSGGSVATGAGGNGGSSVTFPPGGPGPQSVPIRRLTSSEYVASAGDLFPGYSLPPLSFIPDVKVLGYVNLSSSQNASLVLMEQYESAAQAIAQLVAADPAKLTSCDAATKTELLCATTYLNDLAKRAYRRPLTDADKAKLSGLFTMDPTLSYPTRLGLAVEAVLLSPNFIFRPEFAVASTGQNPPTAPLTPWEVATRLSYLLTGSMPDSELTASADSGRLSAATEVAAQTQRLLALPRAQTNLVRFHEAWLGVDSISSQSKDATAFPAFTTLLATYMGTETRTFLQNVIFTQGGTLADLFSANYTFANGPMAAFYGVAAPATDWGRVTFPNANHQGLLTQASLLATMAKVDRTDPVRRGKFVLNQLLCRSIPEPDNATVAKFQPLDLSKTARDQFTQHRNDAVCAGCHNTLDPLGLPFEHFDGMGQWRDTDRGMPIDATGQIDGTPFDGVSQLENLLVDKPEALTCYLTQWFRFSLGRLNTDADEDFLTWFSTKFSRNTKVVDMVVNLVQSDSFRNLKLDPTAGSKP